MAQQEVSTSSGSALNEYVAQSNGKEFSWSANNCGDFIRGWIREATGKTIDVLPHGDTEAEAMDRIVELGGIERMMTLALGCSPIPASMAQVGDIVLVSGGSMGVLCVCNGRTAVGPGQLGRPVFVPMFMATAAWRIREVLQ